MLYVCLANVCLAKFTPEQEEEVWRKICQENSILALDIKMPGSTNVDDMGLYSLPEDNTAFDRKHLADIKSYY